MYNEQLNNQWLFKFREHLSNKRVLLLGNSLSLFADKYGEFIDSFDAVIRVGRGVVYEDLSDYLGVKFDGWSFGSLRAYVYYKCEHVPFKFFNLMQIEFYNSERMYLNFPKILLTEKFQLYKDYFLMGNEKDLKFYLQTIVNKNNERVSQGAITLSFLLNKCSTFKELHVFGFDFFESSTNYILNNNNKRVSHSWHMPMTKGNETQPHNGKVEKDYINGLIRNKKITFHPMTKLDVPEYIKEELLIKFRPNRLV